MYAVKTSFCFVDHKKSAFEAMGQIVGPYKNEAVAIKRLIRSANRFYKKYRLELPFDEKNHFQIRKLNAADFNRGTKIAWYYCNKIDSIYISPDYNFLAKGSFLFESDS